MVINNAYLNIFYALFLLIIAEKISIPLEPPYTFEVMRKWVAVPELVWQNLLVTGLAV